jgi:DNA-binding response OmpR family regulator
MPLECTKVYEIKGTTMIKMLIVDDEIEICDFLKTFFIEKGFEVKSANNAEQAIKMLQDFTPQVLLLDICMPAPGPSGIEVLRKAKEMGIDLKIIMVTAVYDQKVMKLAKELGASDYVTKPFSLDYLERNVLTKVSSLRNTSENTSQA